MNIYSGAFNFGSYLSSSVDPRTGQYNSKIALVSLYPQGSLEVVRDIFLSFSMFNTVNSGYGIGWSLSNTKFDVISNVLTLLSGENFKTHGLPSVGGILAIKDRKLRDIVVKRPDASTLHVIYKDGTVEVLQRMSSTEPYRIKNILFENGEKLTFNYDVHGFLEKILDHQQKELLVMGYSNGSLSLADKRVDGGRYARVLFSYTNNRLTRATAPYDRSAAPERAAYVLEYRSAFRNGLVPIMRIRPPMGGEELITYNENGHLYGKQYMPRVTSWVQSPGSGQAIITRTYAYSPVNNFTGHPFSGGFSEGEDNLYLVGSDYDYWTEEIRKGPRDQVLDVTRTTYNKFHLLIEEQILREGTRTTSTITYNVKPGLFPAQPANVHIPKTITKCFELVAGGTPRVEVQHIETDDYGNELSRTEPSGVRTEYSYYSKDGEAGKCPADPHDLFPRYVKQERLIPAVPTPAARLTEYTYTRVPMTGSSYFVLQESSSQAGVFSARQSYYETPVDLAGRLKSTSNTINGLSLSSDFSYTITGDNLVETRRLKGREGQWLESTRTLSLTNRRLLSMTRDGGSTLALAFDVSGRLTAETVSPGKTQQASRRYAYHFATQGKRAHLITTDAQDNQVITYYDGLGRQVSEAQLTGEGAERITGTWLYDALGQNVEVVNTDYLDDGPRSLKSTYSYNRWGNASRVTRADGSVLVDEYDPLLNIKHEGVEGGERLITYFNEHNQPMRVERLDANEYSVRVESRTYDGLGRCLTILDVSNNLTEFSYDAFDRQLTVHQKPVDGTPHRLRKMDYAAGTSSESAIALTVDGSLLGNRTYDSLGRMTSQAHGTRQATTWEYEPGWMEPVEMVSPRGARQRLTYDKELDVPTRIEMTGLPVSTYGYDPIAGILRRSESNGLTHEFFRDVSGHPEKELETAAGTSLTTLYGYSPGGRLLHQVADGQRSELSYDAQGRFSRMTTDSVVIEQSYDSLGRPQTLTAAYDSTRIVTKVSYDALGREAERRFEQNGTLLQIMTSTYHLNSMLATRFLRDASSRVVIGETFTYDAYLRLKTYRCEGLEHPQDQRGRGIVGQDFSFDSLNNITRVVTAFADGTQDICERFFTGPDPTQLTRLTHTLPVQDVTLTYDAAGNLKVGPAGQVYTYNEFEQLTGVEVDARQYRYQYDAESRQVLASRGSEAPVMLGYAGGRLETLVEGNKKLRYFDGGDQVMARSGGVDGPQLHANDAAGSVRGISAPNQPHVRRHYTPYGDTKIPLDDGKARTMADLQLPAFNGQRLDAAIRLYFLGNGRRAYDPELMMFLQADPLSPFDEGGINSYAYCAGNPINLMDPSGLWPSWLKWLLTGAALVLSIVTVGFGAPALAAAVAGGAAKMAIASKTAILVGAGLGVVGGTLSTAALGVAEVDKAMGWDRSNHINNLGWAAFGFSIASLAVGVGGAYTSAHMAYKAATAKFTGVGKLVDTPIGSAGKAALDRMLGLTYKFTDKAGVTPYSLIFGSTRAILRFTNLGRSIESRSQAGANASPEGSDGGEGSLSASAQPQTQPALIRLKDMPSGSVEYYQAFRDEAARVRQPILRELIQA